MGRARDAVLLGLIVLVSRLPFATHVLWEWDSVLYAKALEQGFHVSADLGDQRPHPPGYLFYVALSAAARWVTGDSNAALVAVSAIASACAAAFIYLLARRLASRELAAFAALAFAVDPLVWAHGEIALPYIVLAAGAAGLALLFWDARHGDLRRALIASAAFGIAGGFRQDLLLVLGPLWLWSLLPGSTRRVALGAIAVALATLVWLVPTALLSGGFEAYLGAIATQSGSITSRSVAAGGTDVLWYDLRFVLLALAWGLFAVGVVLLGLLLAAALHWLRRPRVRRPEERITFFLLWLLPALAIYLFWIIGEWGYVLSILPCLDVLCAVLLGRALSGTHGAPLALARVVLLSLLVGTALAFVGSDGRWSAALLAAHDKSVTDRVVFIRARIAPEATVLLAREDYQLARYYLSEYLTWLYDPAPARTGEAPKSAFRTLVIFTPDLALRQPLDVVASMASEARAAGLAVATGSNLKLFGDYPIAREP